jgi:hypothetical protein
MWFKHRAWIPIAWILSLVNVGAVWFAAQPAEPWHATTHAVLGLLFGLGAQRLAARRRAMTIASGGAEVPADMGALRAELTALREDQSEILKRVEQSVDAVAIELERVGENQRYLTKAMADLPRDSEGRPRS